MRRGLLVSIGMVVALVTATAGLVGFAAAGGVIEETPTPAPTPAGPVPLTIEGVTGGIYATLVPIGPAVRATRFSELTLRFLTITAWSVAVAAAAATIFSLTFSYLTKLPLIGMWPRLRARPWGWLRDRTTGLPVAGALLRLIKVGNREQIAETLSDRRGRFGFTLEQPGSYFLIVMSPGYLSFQSAPFALSDPGTSPVNWQFYLSPQPGASRAKFFDLRRLTVLVAASRQPLFIAGTVLAAVATIAVPSLEHIGLGLAFGLLWLIEWLGSRPPKPYGVVVDKYNGQPVPYAKLNVYTLSPQGERLLKQLMTDSQGRYRLVVQPGHYLLQVVAPRHSELRVGPLELEGLKTEFNQKIALA